jgi:hypothetical protein
VVFVSGVDDNSCTATDGFELNSAVWLQLIQGGLGMFSAAHVCPGSSYCALMQAEGKPPQQQRIAESAGAGT